MRARKILVVDDSAEFRTSVQESLGRAFFITEAASEAEFRKEFRPFTYDLVILDMRLETAREGLGLLREILAYDELQPVIMVSAYGDTDAVLDSAEAGALMFLHKQEFTPELLARMVEAVLQQARVRRHLAALQGRVATGEPAALSGGNPTVRRAVELVQRAADNPESMVLVAGESGTGHEFAAQAVHDRSRKRAAAPLITAAGLGLVTTDFAGALFGASRHNGTPRRKGLLEQANGGVLFLGGMDSLAANLRDALCDTLRKRYLESDAAGPAIPLDLQLVAGSAPDTAGNVAESLRKAAGGDRLIEIYLPPLRDRRQDIPLLAASFLHEFRQGGRTPAKTFSREAIEVLETHPWPGNLLELRNAVEFAAIHALIDGSEELTGEHLPTNLRQGKGVDAEGDWDYRYHVARAEVALVERAIIERRAPNKTQLAELLGYTDRFAFARRMRKALEEHKKLAGEFHRTAVLFGTSAS